MKNCIYTWEIDLRSQRSHLSEESGMQIYLKKDYMQYTGSFKERGARYTLLMLPEEQVGENEIK